VVQATRAVTSLAAADRGGQAGRDPKDTQKGIEEPAERRRALKNRPNMTGCRIEAMASALVSSQPSQTRTGGTVVFLQPGEHGSRRGAPVAHYGKADRGRDRGQRDQQEHHRRDRPGSLLDEPDVQLDHQRQALERQTDGDQMPMPQTVGFQPRPPINNTEPASSHRLPPRPAGSFSTVHGAWPSMPAQPPWYRFEGYVTSGHVDIAQTLCRQYGGCPDGLAELPPHRPILPAICPHHRTAGHTGNPEDLLGPRGSRVA
jgi:hypothetical protein